MVNFTDCAYPQFPSSKGILILLNLINIQLLNLTPVFWSDYRNITVEWPWRYRSKSKIVIHDTPSHSSVHVCQIWNESTKTFRFWHISQICQFCLGLRALGGGQQVSRWRPSAHYTRQIFIQFIPNRFWPLTRQIYRHDKKCTNIQHMN